MSSTRNSKNPYKKQQYGVDPQVFERPLMATGYWSQLARNPGFTPTPLLQGQTEYSRGKYANMVSEPNKEIKNIDQYLQGIGPGNTGPNEPFWDPTLNANAEGYMTIGRQGTTNAKGTLCEIPQGTSANQREGRQVIVTGIVVRANIRATNQMSNTLQETDLVVRLMLLLDRQCNGSAPSMDELLQDKNDNVNAFINLNNAQRFVILQDKYITFNATGNNRLSNGSSLASEPYLPHKQISMVHKCNIPIQYASVNGTVNEIRANNILLVAWASSDATSASSGNGIVQIQSSSRVLYIG